MRPETDQADIINMIDVINRLKDALRIATDAELARIMGVPPKRIGVWKSRNTVPTKELLKLCSTQQLDMQYMLTGVRTETAGTTEATLSPFPELDQIFKEAGVVWNRLDQASRYELASKILKSMAGYK